MSKYTSLWEYLRNDGNDVITLSFDDIGRIVGTALDHSFLTYKKELTDFGYSVKKISMKSETVIFTRTEE